MAEIKEPEQFLKEMHELVDKYAKAKQVSVVRPIPIVRDRRKGAVNELTLKDWLQKLNEEVDELKDELLSVYTLDEVVPSGYVMPEGNRKLIVSELCDVIEVLYSMANQMGIDGDMIQQGIYDTNKKLKERGCID